MYIVCVTFKIAPEHFETFLPLMRAQAENSLSQEPECHQFDVSLSETEQSTIFLYEKYTNRAAFDVHLASDHFKEFDAAVSGLVLDKKVEMYQLA